MKFQIRIVADTPQDMFNQVVILAKELDSANRLRAEWEATSQPEPEPEPSKPSRNKVKPALDRETAVRQLKGEPKGPPKSEAIAPPVSDPEADRKFVTDYLLAHWSSGDPTAKMKVQTFSQWVKSGHDDVGVRDLPAEAFPAIRRQLEKDFGLS